MPASSVAVLCPMRWRIPLRRRRSHGDCRLHDGQHGCGEFMTTQTADIRIRAAARPAAFPDLARPVARRDPAHLVEIINKVIDFII